VAERVGSESTHWRLGQLALDETRNHALALVRAGQPGLELALDDRVERRALGLAPGRANGSPVPDGLLGVGRHARAECEPGASEQRMRGARCVQESSPP
jgi:hypothetical protein